MPLERLLALPRAKFSNTEFCRTDDLQCETSYANNITARIEAGIDWSEFLRMVRSLISNPIEKAACLPAL